MATIQPRGNTYAVIYSVKGADGKHKNYWESYRSELEAVQRKAHIDVLQRMKDVDELRRTAETYRTLQESESATNYDKTFKEFAEKWLPYYTRKKKLSPATYDSIARNLNNHILPYFGDRIVSTILSEDLDKFLDHLGNKKCSGSKSYNKDPDQIPFLGSASVKKCFHVLNSALKTAKNWRYTEKRPQTIPPPVYSKERDSWSSEHVKKILEDIRDPFLHLLVHLTFICSLRVGEAAGLSVENIDLLEGSVWIRQELLRVTDAALNAIPKEDIFHVFPKQVPSSKSSLVLKKPKTNGSVRKIFLPAPLVDEIRIRVARIEKYKAFYGDEYRDSGLLFCLDNGNPNESKRLEKKFSTWQKQNDIANPIDLQGLRKSGQTHKVHVTDNDYHVVSKAGGQSTAVLFNHYLKVDESELINLKELIEGDFYGSPDPQKKNKLYVQTILDHCKEDPEFLALLMSGLQSAHTTAKKVAVR